MDKLIERERQRVTKEILNKLLHSDTKAHEEE